MNVLTTTQPVNEQFEVGSKYASVQGAAASIAGAIYDTQIASGAQSVVSTAGTPAVRTASGQYVVTVQAVVNLPGATTVTLDLLVNGVVQALSQVIVNVSAGLSQNVDWTGIVSIPAGQSVTARITSGAGNFTATSRVALVAFELSN